jgi:hypothetical protein
LSFKGIFKKNWVKKKWVLYLTNTPKKGNKDDKNETTKNNSCLQFGWLIYNSNLG